MEAQAYINQLKAYAEDFHRWWIEPYEKFYTGFDKQNRKLLLGFLPIRMHSKESMAKLNEAAKQFEKEVLQKRNLFNEIFAFLDAEYESYLKATDLQRREIRSVISDTFYNLRYEEKPLSYYEGSYMQMVIKKYRHHAFKEFKSSGEEIWLARALVAVSIEDCCSDFRETLTYLVVCQSLIEGYSFLSLIRASFVVNCQSTVALIALRCSSQERISWMSVSSSGIRRSRHCRNRTLNSISAMLSQLPCFGV